MAEIKIIAFSILQFLFGCLFDLVLNSIYFLIGKFREQFGTQHQLALILGTNYSNSLFQKLQNSSYRVNQHSFQSHRLRNQSSNKKNFYVVSCPYLTLDQAIDQREKCIEQFQKFFKREVLLKSSTKCLYIVVEYERTDLMKTNLLGSMKWFQQYRDLINIVVTSCEKADDQINYKEELQNAFSSYLQNDNQRLIFVNSNDDPTHLNRQFLNAAENVSMKGEFLLKNTVFEPLDEKETNKMLQQLHIAISKQNK